MTRFCTCPESFPSSLESSGKRNQLAEASCKTCGGRFLVDGIGPISRSMIESVDLEVTNSINPELSWKTVTKGKRSRKSVARANGRGVVGSKSPKRVGDFSGSDSDKFGEAGIGQCFPEKAECVPIKKRRHYLRSPSPSSRTSLYGGESLSPQLCTPSSHLESNEHLSDHNGSSGSYTNTQEFIAAQVSNGVNDGVVGDKPSELTVGELYNSDNFSGIALLAAAACINNIDDNPCDVKGDAMEVSSAPQRSDTSASSLPMRESIPCSESGKPMSKDVSRLDDKGHTRIVEGSVDYPCDVKGDAMEVSSATQRSDTSASSLPMRDSIPCSDSGKPMSKDVSRLDDKGHTRIVEGSVDSPHGSDENETGKSVASKVDTDENEAGKSVASKVDADENEAGKSVASKVDRRHWDLNTPMDAWEQPNDDSSDHYNYLDASIDGIQTMKVDKEGSVIQRDSSSNGIGTESCLSPKRIESAIHSSTPKVKNEPEEFCDISSNKETSLSSLNGHPLETLKFSPADTKLSSHVPSGNESIGNFAFSEICHSSEVSGGNMDAKSCCVSTIIHASEVSGGNLDTKSCSLSTIIHAEDICRDASSLLNTSEQNVALPEASDLERSGGENDGQLKDAEDTEKIPELPDNSIALGEEKCVGTRKTQDTENLESTSKDNSHPSAKDEGLSVLDIYVGGHSTVICDVKNEDEKVVCGNALVTDAGQHSGSKQLLSLHEEPQICNREAEGRSTSLESDSGKDDCRKLDISQDDPAHVDGRDHIDELQVGYDSPYEDGELRGSVLHSWEEGFECEDGENECIDYESDGRGSDDSDAGDCPCSKIVESGSEGSQGTEKKSSIAAVQVQETDSRRSSSVKSPSRGELKDNGEKIETAGKKTSNQGSGIPEELSTDVIVKGNGDSMRRGRTYDQTNAVDGKGSYTGEAGSKSTRGKLQSRVERPSMLDDNDNVYAPQSRSRNTGSSYSRVDRDGSPERFMTRYRSAIHGRERNGGNSQLVYWDSRNRYPSSYHGPEGHGTTKQRGSIADSVNKFGGVNSHDQKQSINYSSQTERDESPDRFATRYRSAVHEHERVEGDGQLFYWESRNRDPFSYLGPEDQGHTRPRSAMADTVDKFGGLNSHDHKQSVNYSSKCVQRPLGWRRSPIDRDNYHGGQRRMGGFSSNERRGGSRNFSDGVGRSLGEEYHQHVNEDAASSARMPHYLSWKERSFFPPSTRGSHVTVPRRNSRSRSRTRSPRAWKPQIERNLGTRRHSRSPDFRSEARMDRTRAQFQKPSFAADYGDTFLSPPRGRFSPQRNFREVDDRNFVDNHLRHRRSPFNVPRQNQRLDSIGLSGRLKSDDSFRPMMRPGRFPPMGSVGRG